MSYDAGLLLGDIEALARHGDFAELEAAVATLAGLIRSGEARPAPADVHRTASALRAKRQFGALAALAGAMEAKGLADPTLRRLHAQALIDSRRVDEALPLLDRLIAGLPEGEREHKEARGLLGRAWKQKYLDRDPGEPPTPADAAALRQAIAEYGTVVQKGDFARDHWHLVNFVALTARAERDGVHPGHEVEARVLAQALVEAIGDRADDAEADMWTLASLGEAMIALGDLDRAKAIYQRYLVQPAINAFEVFSSYRQLGEVWQLESGEGIGGEILGLLENRLVELIGAAPVVAASDVVWMESVSAATRSRPAAAAMSRPAAAAAAGSGEARRASVSMVPFDWMLRTLRQATAVARIKERYFGRHVGTGFLVRGSDLAAFLGPDIVLVTNSHVVGRLDGASHAPRQVEIELRDLSQRIVSLAPGDQDVAWESPVDQLDTTVLRLKGLPAEFEPLQLCAPDELPADYPALNDEQRHCYCIGHAGDLQLSITLEPNRIHDLGWRDPAAPGHVFIHHDAETRDGSSGSPLFNLGWRVIGIHRASTAENQLLPALGGRPGDRVAKVAVSIHAVRAAMADPAAAAAARPGAGALSDQQLLALLQSGAGDEADIEPLVELDEDHSRPFQPVLRRRLGPDGARPENALSDAWWSTVATAVSIGFRTRRNRQFGRRADDGRGLTFVSDGDSWFQYPIPGISDIIDHLRQTHSIYCHAVAGSELRAAAARAHERILPSIRENKPDGVLLSGGGNDLLGYDAIDLHVAPFREGEPAEAHILPSLDNTLNLLVGYYERMIADILSVDPKLKIFCHGYDWALPAAPGGRWLFRPLSEARRIKDLSVQQQIVKVLIDRFNASLAGLEARYKGNVFHVDCRGATGATRAAWYDELHPRSPGFGRIAGRFNRRIAEAYAGDPRVIGIA